MPVSGTLSAGATSCVLRLYLHRFVRLLFAPRAGRQWVYVTGGSVHGAHPSVLMWTQCGIKLGSGMAGVCGKLVGIARGRDRDAVSRLRVTIHNPSIIASR